MNKDSIHCVSDEESSAHINWFYGRGKDIKSTPYMYFLSEKLKNVFQTLFFTVFYIFLLSILANSASWSTRW